MSKLETPKQVSYHKRCLTLLPYQFTGNDLNRMSLGFFLLNSLDILDQLSSTTSYDRREWIDWIYKCQTPTGGFRGSTATITEKTSIYDVPHLPANYFALASLLILADDLKRVNREGILDQLRRSQNEDGSFSPVLINNNRIGESDVRQTYCAIAVRHILSPVSPEEDINVAAALSYVQSCKVRVFHRLLMIDL